MPLSADRNLAVADLLARIAGTGVAIWRSAARTAVCCPFRAACRRFGALQAGVAIRVVDAEMTATVGGGGWRAGRYRLVTTLLDHHRHPARDIAARYRRRREIETAYPELSPPQS